MTTLKSNLLKKGKKGFTLTELAIVIAVIAILIAVLVPTFTSVITNARKTTAAEDAKGVITAYTLETYQDLPNGAVIVSGDYYFEVSGGNIDTESGVNDTLTTTDYVEFEGWTTYTQYAYNDSITLYFSTDYVVANYKLDGFVASAKAATEAAAVANDTQTWIGATVTVTGTSTATYYFTIDSNVATVTGTAVSGTSASADTTTTTGYSVVLISASA